ncbi:putative transmembrane protein [Chlamydia psittaci 08DC60]|nr:putative transmembrane protein [Chlamydia psittaci 08DC60]
MEITVVIFTCFYAIFHCDGCSKYNNFVIDVFKFFALDW